MDAERFDRLVKTLALLTSRRGALPVLVVGPLSLLGLAGVTVGRSNRRHGPRADARQGRHASAEGPCGRGTATSNTCRRHGQCCTGRCDKRKGRCRCQHLAQSCKEDRNCCAALGQPMRCQDGRCATLSGTAEPVTTPPPLALAPPPPGCTPNDPCTAGVCGTVPNSCGQDVRCGSCPAGQLCADHQCVTGQGSCAAGDNFCQDVTKNCNGACRCRISTEGDTRCSGIAPGGGNTCGECTQSSDCALLYPAIPGVFCMQGGTGCCAATAPAGLCHAPCPG
jgi:hypothetical protein